MADVPHVLAVIGSLGGGGAERVMTIVLNDLVKQGWKVTLVSRRPPTEGRFAVPAGVDTVILPFVPDVGGVWSKARRLLRMVRDLRRIIRARQPNVVLSFITEINVVTLTACPANTPVLVSERTDPRSHRINPFWITMRRITYPRATAVVVQTSNIVSWAERTHPRWKVVRLANPVSSPVSRPLLPPSGRPRRVVAVGRLHEAKGPDLLLTAFSAALGSRPDWELAFIGEGPMKAALQLQARELEIEHRVRFEGWADEPFDGFEEGDIFALSSRYEGFPNALGEAIARGLPCVGFDVPSGAVHDLLDGGRAGLLVPSSDVQSLSEAIRRLADQPELQRRLGDAARQHACQFSSEATLEKWRHHLSQATEISLNKPVSHQEQ